MGIKSLYFLLNSLVFMMTILCHDVGKKFNLSDSQSSPIPISEGLFLAPRCWEDTPIPHPSPNSPACTSCESPDYTGCHGDTHYPSLLVPSCLGLLPSLHMWRLGDHGEAGKYLICPLAGPPLLWDWPLLGSSVLVPQKVRMLFCSWSKEIDCYSKTSPPSVFMLLFEVHPLSPRLSISVILSFGKPKAKRGMSRRQLPTPHLAWSLPAQSL